MTVRRSSLYFLEFNDLSRSEFDLVRLRILNREDVELAGTSGYSKLRFTFRASGDEMAKRAAEALSAGRVHTLTTGLGIHRRAL